MNVLFLTDNPNLGSTSRILQSWLPLGSSLGMRGHVAAPPGSLFLRWLSEHNIPHVASAMPWPSRWWPLPSLYAAWKLARWARHHRVQIIHCNEHNVYPFALLLRRLLGLPLVCHVRYKIEPAFCQWAFGGSRRPDALLWTSRNQQADCAEAVAGLVPAERQQIIPLGLDLDTFGTRRETRESTRSAWGFGPDEIILGQACALRPRKRLGDFIQLVAQLAGEDERVVGVLAGDAVSGDEPYRERILQQIKETGLGRRFRWLGNIDDMEPFYQGIDVFLSTSEYETFGNSVCEAMACGRPVIAYRGGSVAEVVGEGGLIVENGDLSGLISAVRECLANRVELGRLARQRVADQFNPAATLTQLVHLYRSLR